MPLQSSLGNNSETPSQKKRKKEKAFPEEGMAFTKALRLKCPRCSKKCRDDGVSGAGVAGRMGGDKELKEYFPKGLVGDIENFLFALNKVGAVEGSKQRRDLH